MVVNNERYKFIVYKRKPNTPYEWEQAPTLAFRGRPANQYERKQYRIQQGVNGNTDSIFVISSNLPKDVKPKDQVEFMGKKWTVASVGYYFDEARFVNPAIMSEEHIAAKCPKGLNLQ